VVTAALLVQLLFRLSLLPPLIRCQFPVPAQHQTSPYPPWPPRPAHSLSLYTTMDSTARGLADHEPFTEVELPGPPATKVQVDPSQRQISAIYAFRPKPT